MSSMEGAGVAPQVVVVAGSGRSGTSSIAGVLKIAGLRIPPPEIPGNRSNPRGFFEPRWAVDLQTRLLRRSGGMLTDARPAAFDLCRAVGEDPEVRESVGQWLREETRNHPAVLIKDPRNSWFLPMWRRGAADAGAEVSFLTMLRHPAEVVGSKDTYYKARSAGETVRQAQTTRVAAWLNVALFSELQTRDARRTFVLYNDLLEDWRPVTERVGRELGLAALDRMPDEVATEIGEFVDPGLRRVRMGWDEIDCPDDVREMAQAAWDQLSLLSSTGGRDADAEATLDAIRERYVLTYADAEALAQSSAEAAQRAGARRGRQQLLKEQRKAARHGGEVVRGDRSGATARSLAGRVRRKVRGFVGRARRVRRG